MVAGPAVTYGGRRGPTSSLTPNEFANSHENIDPFYHSIFSRKPVIFLSYVQVGMSCLAILSQIMAMIYPYGYVIPYGYGAALSVFAYGSSGIWCGILFGISGTFGIWAGCHPSKCTIIAHMVFAIISACVCIPLIIGSVMFAIGIFDNGNVYGAKGNITLGIFIGLSVVGLLQAVLSLTTSALSCSVICCHTKSANEGGTITSSEWKPKFFPMSDKPVVWMSVIQIIISILAMVLNIVGILYPSWHRIADVGTAFWCAIPFLLCGVFGIWSGLRPSKCSVITFMVLAIISTLFSLLFFGISIVGFVSSTFYSSHLYKRLFGIMGNGYFDGRTYERKVSFGLFLAQTLIALTQLMISINSSAMACQPICCPTRNTKEPTRNEDVEIQHQMNQIVPVNMDTEIFIPRSVHVASPIPAKPFPYKCPKDLVYLSSTNASLAGHLKVQSTSNTPDVY